MPQVTLQIMPFDRGGYAGASGCFSILRFEEPTCPTWSTSSNSPVPCTWNSARTSNTYLDVMEQLSGEALNPAETIRFITHVAQET